MIQPPTYLPKSNEALHIFTLSRTKNCKTEHILQSSSDVYQTKCLTSSSLIYNNRIAGFSEWNNILQATINLVRSLFWVTAQIKFKLW
jgi:hypothetical protein